MIVRSPWLRRIHKWVGLVIGLQVLLWAISGTAMALLAMDAVSGGPVAKTEAPPVAASGAAWRRIQQSLARQPIRHLSLRMAGTRHVVEVTTPAGVRLFDAADGAPVLIDRAAAARIAAAAHPSRAAVEKVMALGKVGLAVREHELPIWQVDFSDAANSSYFVSGTTGAILERRNDSWRWWDFFWMLHTMDYAERTSFNHPLVITAGFATAWLTLTGFWLLFRTMWRHDVAAIRKWLRTRTAA